MKQAPIHKKPDFAVGKYPAKRGESHRGKIGAETELTVEPVAFRAISVPYIDQTIGMLHHLFRDFATDKQYLCRLPAKKEILGNPGTNDRIKVWGCMRDNLSQSTVLPRLSIIPNLWVACQGS